MARVATVVVGGVFVLALVVVVGVFVLALVVVVAVGLVLAGAAVVVTSLAAWTLWCLVWVCAAPADESSPWSSAVSAGSSVSTSSVSAGSAVSSSAVSVGSSVSSASLASSSFWAAGAVSTWREPPTKAVVANDAPAIRNSATIEVPIERIMRCVVFIAGQLR